MGICTGYKSSCGVAGAWRRSGIIVLFVLMVVSVATASTDVVVKDHVTEPTLWSATDRILNWEDIGTQDFYLATAFPGNGGVITTVEGLYWSEKNDVPNAGVWANMDFAFRFFSDAAAFQADPRVGTASFTISQPTNLDWLTPVATMGEYDLLHFVFDVSALGVTTTAGQEHLLTMTPSGNVFNDGRTGMVYSNGGPGALGDQLDWWVSFEFITPEGPDTLQNLTPLFGGFVADFAANKVTLGPSPCPADTNGDMAVSVADLLNLLTSWGDCPGFCTSDLNNDGVISVADLLQLLTSWGPCP